MTYSEALNTVRIAIRSLDERDRLRLAEAIWQEVDESEANAPVCLTDEQKAELDRRIADDDAHPDDGVPWDQVLSAARARHGR